jgi:hypothetical protein
MIHCKQELSDDKGIKIILKIYYEIYGIYYDKWQIE